MGAARRRDIIRWQRASGAFLRIHVGFEAAAWMAADPATIRSLR